MLRQAPSPMLIGAQTLRHYGADISMGHGTCILPKQRLVLGKAFYRFGLGRPPRRAKGPSEVGRAAQMRWSLRGAQLRTSRESIIIRGRGSQYGSRYSYWSYLVYLSTNAP